MLSDHRYRYYAYCLPQGIQCRDQQRISVQLPATHTKVNQQYNREQCCGSGFWSLESVSFPWIRIRTGIKGYGTGSNKKHWMVLNPVKPGSGSKMIQVRISHTARDSGVGTFCWGWRAKERCTSTYLVSLDRLELLLLHSSPVQGSEMNPCRHNCMLQADTGLQAQILQYYTIIPSSAHPNQTRESGLSSLMWYQCATASPWTITAYRYSGSKSTTYPVWTVKPHVCQIKTNDVKCFFFTLTKSPACYIRTFSLDDAYITCYDKAPAASQ